MGDTDNSDFGSDGSGKNNICHVIPNALRIPKMYILSMLENSRVITIPITLCVTNKSCHTCISDEKNHIRVAPTPGDHAR